MQSTIKSVAAAMDQYALYRAQGNYAEFALTKWANPRKFSEVQEISNYFETMSAANSTPADGPQAPDYYQHYDLSAIGPLQAPTLDVSSIEDGREFKGQDRQEELIREIPQLSNVVDTLNQRKGPESSGRAEGASAQTSGEHLKKKS